MIKIQEKSLFIDELDDMMDVEHRQVTEQEKTIRFSELLAQYLRAIGEQLASMHIVK